MTTDAQIVARLAAQQLRLFGEQAGRWAPLPHQIPPPSGTFYGWLLMAGRGAGKTDTCAKYMVDHVKGPPCLKGPTPHWMGIIAPTLGDAATSCFSGPSGISAHDPSARMVNTIGGTVVRWPNGSEAKLFGAHSVEDTERLRSGGNRCAVEGTLVQTEHGPVSIEDVRVGDQVWTRNGLRRVLKTWDNGIKEVHRYDHDAGSTWLTPDHRVWTDRGWREAAMVEPSDTVFTWQTTSNMTVPAGTRASVIPTTGTVIGAYCTDGCTPGKSGRSQPVCRCTTKITTSGTTKSATLCFSGPENTGLSTGKNADLTGTARAAGHQQLNGSPATSPVNTAVLGSPQSTLHSEWSGTALRGVGKLPLRHEHGSNGCAACAAAPLSAKPVTRSAPVRAGVLRSSPTSRVARVYDLMVEHDHEFFANGLLVSNCFSWLEELAAWRYLDAAWNQMRFGLRAGPHPHWVGSTTPKPRLLIKRLDRGDIARVVVGRASMYDNPHLPADIREALEDEYGGTQLGRQELLGQLIDEDENALWKHRTIDAARIGRDELPDLGRISVGVDPSGGAGEQGIIVAARSKLMLAPFNMPPEEGITVPASPRPQKHGYVLDDRTVHKSPDGWGKAVIKAAVDWDADEIFVETNYGGAMCVSVIRTAAENRGVNIPIKIVTATRGKAIRAEPVSALTSQGRWHHAGTFEALEDQMATWHDDLGWSPDRLDACLVSGTRITTRRGQIPVEAVTTDDQVWTRRGWKHVTQSGMTIPSTQVSEVVTSAGSFTATPNHRVWVQGEGFTRVDALVCGDTLDACPGRLIRWSSTASRSFASRSRAIARLVSISPRTGTTGAYLESGSSMSKCGRPTPVGTQSHRITSSTTWISIPSTTIRRTSGVSPAGSTPGYTKPTETTAARSGWRIWRTSDHSPLSGTTLRKAAPGTRSTAGMSTPGVSTGPSSVPSAERRTPREAVTRPGTALVHAYAVLLTIRTATSILFRAPSVVWSSCRASTGLFRQHVPVRVERVSALATEQPVYDLTVEDQPEFYANGILVHNSVWNGWGLRLAHLMAGGQGSMGGSAMSQKITPGR